MSILVTDCIVFSSDFAAALVNPIAHQEKHAQQLAVLTEDFDYSVCFLNSFLFLKTYVQEYIKFVKK